VGVIIQEGGLLGSQAIAKDYEKRSVNVLAMSQVRDPSNHISHPLI
jgi:hypothetical protein